MSDIYQYHGPELEIFAFATNWQRYVADMIIDNVNGKVLEVGAGIGCFTKAFCLEIRPNQIDSWWCLEPDPKQTAIIQNDIDRGILPAFCMATAGTLDSLPDHQKFDTILYVDVLEHIEDDRAELANSAAHLALGGKLVVLAPAHGWLFSELDRNAGHFRRYTSGSLVSLNPPDTKLMSCRYYDCVGIVASLANRILLRQGIPTPAQISVWDRLMVPISRRFDPLIGYRIGKSVLGLWEKVI
jgi:SAM-dependent methyltransferase